MLCLYFQVFGHAVDVDIQGDTSGSFQTLCLVQLNREEDAVSQTNESIAEKDARRIWRVSQFFFALTRSFSDQPDKPNYLERTKVYSSSHLI